jgi:hypothetical protein
MIISTLVIVSLEIFFMVFIHRNAMISSQPTPTSQPSRQPSGQPTRQPFSYPSSQPSRQPSSHPSGQPSSRPSYASGIPNLYMQLVAGTSNRGFSGDNGPATSSQISARVPWVDSSGNLYIPDGDNAKIRKVNSVTGMITYFGGTTSSPNGNGGPIGLISFFAPYAIVGDIVGTFLYISDEMFVWKYGFSNDVVSLVTFDVGFSGDEGPAAVAQVNGPKGLWLTTDDDLYIADSNNHRIRRIHSEIISTIVGSGCSNACPGGYSGDDGPATAATLSNPTGVYVDSNGKIFIADSSNNRIRLVNNNIITTFAGTGLTDPFNGDNILATTANLKNPQDVKGDSLGNIYIADFDNQIIRMINTNRVITTIFGSLGMSGFSTGTTQRSSIINTPLGIWIDSNSVIYFCDRNSIHRSYLVPVMSSKLFLKAIAGSNVAGFQGDFGQATSARLQPQSPFVDTNGKLYIPDDTNARIRSVDPTTGIISTFGGLGSLSTGGASAPIATVLFNTPYSIVGDKAGTYLYVSDQRYVWKYVFTTNIISVYAHSTALPSGFTGDDGPASLAQLTYPKGLWLTTAGDLYIADTGNNRIRKITSANGIITTVAGSTSPVGFSGDNGPATSAGLNTPTGVYMNSVGFLYIADTNNYRIRVVDMNRIITTFAGCGIITPFNGNNIPATSSNIKSPLDVKGDSLGNIYIVDNGFSIIRMVDIAGIITTLFGSPSNTGLSNGIYPVSLPLNLPRGIWLDTLANIYFSDSSKIHRTVEVSSPTSQPSGQPQSGPTSQPSRQPSGQPTRQPLAFPSAQPTRNPISHPTSQPSRLPTAQPSRKPSSQPSRQPTSQPMGKPSSQPSVQPSTHPTTGPTVQPSCPSGMPTTQPTSSPPTTAPITSQPTTPPVSSQPTTPPISSQPTSPPATFLPTPLPSSLPSGDPTRQPFGRPSSQPTRNPLSQPTVQPSRLPTSQPTDQPTHQPLGQPSSPPSQQPYNSPTAKPSCQPNSPPSAQPTSRPSKQPTSQPTLQPFSRPTVLPSSHPSRQPNSLPSVIPTMQPSGNPSIQPTAQSSTQPTTQPTGNPSLELDNQPTTIYTDPIPSNLPFGKPTSTPTRQPSTQPSGQPSSKPTSTPARPPTSRPTPTHQPIGNPPSGLPSAFPLSQPSNRPSCRPSKQPSSGPSAQPTSFPTNHPTGTPTLEPTVYPTSQQLSFVPTTCPSVGPSSQPSRYPSARPSNYPTFHPFSIPSSTPSFRPSAQPSSFPSVKPSQNPSSQPTIRPFSSPSSVPTKQPSSRPSAQPSIQPSKQPASRPSRQPISHPSSQPTRVPSSSFPSSIPTIVTENPTPRRAPSISAYPSQTNKPTKQPITRKPTAVPSVRPSFVPTPLPTQTISVLPSGNNHFKESLFFFGAYLPVVENIPNLYLTEEAIGSSYVIFGFRKESSNIKELIIGTRNSQGLYGRIIHEAGLVPDQAMSRSVLPIGDFNGDSHEDLVICDPIKSYCFVYLGQGNGFLNLQVAFVIKSPTDDLFGWSIAKLNDLNGDNYSDMAISALSSNIIYIFFGWNRITADIVVDQLNSFIAIKIVGSQFDQNTGLALSSAGDFNNDSFADVFFSAIQINPYQNVVYVLFLNPEILKQDIAIDKLRANTDYCKITAPLFSFAGFSLSNLGDINQDGFDDIIIGSIPYSGRYLTQKSYVLYGRNSSSNLLLTEMTEEDGFVITGGGFLVGGPGDVNGDGIPDILISSYEHWQGKGNSYIMVYPSNMTSSPTYLPTSQPSSVPSSSPTTFPSLKIQFPTNVPSIHEMTNEPVNEGTFPPFLQATQLPSVAPKTSKPTRIPSIRPSTRCPTVKSDPPSFAPTTTRKPTVNPTRLPTTTIPIRKASSKVPTTNKRLITSRFPTSTPSMTPTESLSTLFQEITIDREGDYYEPRGKTNYLVTGEGNIQITGNGGGQKLYVIFPSKNTIIIMDFHKRYDQISLIHFPDLYSINDLVYRTHPLQIFLSKEQKLILPSVDASALMEDNFIFQGSSSNHKKTGHGRLSVSAMIAVAILVSCAGLVGFLMKMNEKEEDEQYLLKDTLQDMKHGIDAKNENVAPTELQNENEKEFSESSSAQNDDGNNEEDSKIEERERSQKDWNLFSSLTSFFSSADSDEPDNENPVGPLLYVFDVNDSVEEQSFIFTESDDSEEDVENDDIEGNYNTNNGDGTFIQ